MGEVEPLARHELRVLFADEFCGCGTPEAAWGTIQKLLSLHPLYDNQREFDKWYPDPGVQMLLLGRLDELRLTEHGGTITGGWLTDLGRAALAGLDREASDDFIALSDGGCIHGFDFTGTDHDCMAAGDPVKPTRSARASVSTNEGGESGE